MTTTRTIFSTSILAATLALGLGTTPVWSSPARAADAVTDANVAQVIASAKTADDFKAIAAYFRDEAKQAADTVALHEAMMKSWNASVSGKALDRMREHCHGLMAEARKMQKQYDALAVEYDGLAKAAAH